MAAPVSKALSPSSFRTRRRSHLGGTPAFCWSPSTVRKRVQSSRSKIFKFGRFSSALVDPAVLSTEPILKTPTPPVWASWRAACEGLGHPLFALSSMTLSLLWGSSRIAPRLATRRLNRRSRTLHGVRLLQFESVTVKAKRSPFPIAATVDVKIRRRERDLLGFFGSLLLRISRTRRVKPAP